MTETTSRSQLRRREAGWEGRWRRNRDPRDTNRIEGGAVRTRRRNTSKSGSSKDRNVDAAGARGRLLPLSEEACRGVGLDACRPTPAAERRPVTRQESAEAVVAVGSCAAKGRTRSRGKARPCSRKPQSQPRPRDGAFAQWTLKVSLKLPAKSRAAFRRLAPQSLTPPPPGTSGRSSSPEATWRPRSGASSKTPVLPASMGCRPRNHAPGCMTTGPRSEQCSTRAPTDRNPPGGSRSQSPPAASGSWGCRRPWIE